MNGIRLIVCIFLFLSLIFFYNHINSIPLFQNLNSDQTHIDPIVFDEFEIVDGIEIGDINFWQELIRGSYDRRRVYQLSGGSTKGIAEISFFEHTAKYDLTVYYVEGRSADSEVNVFINGNNIGSITYGSSHSFQEKTFKDINIQKWSKITLEFVGKENSKCRVEKLILTPVGVFDGEVSDLKKPATLKIFESYHDKQRGRRIFFDFVKSRIDSANAERDRKLNLIKNSRDEQQIGSRWQEAGIEKWKTSQNEIRKNLHRYFGPFPEKTPLNAKITGKLEYENYAIEKVIFESQPGFFVTANLYVPKGREFPVPGVVFPLGHSDAGKSRDAYHMSGLGMVLKGYVVLVFDPIGQGERSEYLSEDEKSLVHVGVDQHWYVGRPAFLVDWTLSGLRTWDGIRAVDYLVSRPEVDQNKLAAVGCSGGGQMALLITAVDERIKVCAASHPGGPMENTYLAGKKLIDKEIYSLIPPRPLRIIVGNESGEEPRYREYVDDLQFFYEGYRVGRQSVEIDVVPGPHSMNRSNRESAYEWLNKWFDKEAEGKAEAVLKVEKEEDLWCTESGNTLTSLGSETGQSLNEKRVGQVYNPEGDFSKLKERISARIGLALPENMPSPEVKTYDTYSLQEFSIEKLTFRSEKDIVIPAILIKPKKVKSNSPVYVYVSEDGKPERFDDSDLPFMLARSGHIVFAIDVRGIGETSPTPGFSSNQYTGHTPLLRVHDDLAIQCAEFGKTTLGMRTFDVIRAVDFLKSRRDLKGRKVVVVGEKIGGLWALMASILDQRVEGIVTIGTLPSYMPLITSKYYNKVWGYFWLPGALRDFDIPDMSRLNSQKPQVWIDPINALGERAALSEATSILGSIDNLKIIISGDDKERDFIQPITSLLDSVIKTI
jgi:cephalosporin-C deacetylase-like acetyl esterase